MKSIHLCADDFGLNDGVSQGILALLEAQRLSAVSCMVEQPDFLVHAQALAEFKKKAQIGLHFNLTENHGFSLTELIVKAHLNVLPMPLIAKALDNQIAQFIEIMGFFPHFIDGHQHVHQLPGVRKALLTKAATFKKEASWIRCTTPSSYSLKAFILALTGGMYFRYLLRKNGLPSNASFAGIYNFDPQNNYRALFRRWLSQAQPGSLIMCHPGFKSLSQDAISATRPLELAYFLSPEFLEDCTQYQCKLYYS